ncbi:MAG: hypothetical protein IPJ88_06095 [Myxococcales bacterium]|nr:MAG: hypothetical protein IPJ88_06095 [Myxococcales bacterium]
MAETNKGACVLEVFDGYKSLGRHVIGLEPLVVGTDPKANVSLPKDSGLRPVHFSLQRKGSVCQLRLAPDAKLQMAGMPIQSGPLPWDATLVFASLRFQLEEERTSALRSSGNSLVWLVLLLCVPLLMWLYSGNSGVDVSAIPKADFEQFVAKQIECPEQGPARYRAERLLESAASKEERYLFEPHDGIEAIQLYAQAAACMASAGQINEAQVAEKKSKKLKTRIRRDFILHQVKLERALAEKDHRQALGQARILVNMVGHEKSDYLTWLQHIERQLNAILSKEVAS